VIKFELGEWNIEFKKDSKPKIAVVEISSECNLKCRYCFRNSLREKIDEKYIDVEILKKIVDEDCIDKIVFTGFGEPTLHPNFQEILELSLKNCRKVLINTNGLKILEYVDMIKKNIEKVELVFSYHDDKLLYIMENFIDKLRDVKHRLSTKLIVMIDRKSVDSIDNVLSSVVGKFSIVVLSNIVPISKDTLEDTCIGCEDCEKIVRTYLTKNAFKFMLQGTCVKCTNFRLNTSTFTCPFVESGAFYVRVDGKVTPCLFFSHNWKIYLQGIEREVESIIFGDLNNSKLLDIWRCLEYVKFRFRVFMRQYPSCLDCELVEYCTFTISNRHDCWGNSPSCAFCPFARELVYCPI